MRLSALLLSLFLSFSFYGQNNFDFYLEPLNISNLSGLQSFAHGEYQGKWILFGGRLDGLHQRQPFAAFSNNGHNNQIIVVDINTESSQSFATNSLPNSLYDQLRSTNMQFYQEDSLLFLIGGYGYSSAQADHITHPYLTVINLKGLLDSLNSGGSIVASFQQILDQDMAVTGGYLKSLYGDYYLVGGHRFDGRYNPHNGGSFTQSYTNAVRRFQLQNSNGSYSISWLNPYSNSALFHRRDYNVLPQIGINGQHAMIAFSGVFQANVDLPFLNAIYIDSAGYNEIPNFSQYYNHYHCASFSMYDSADQSMHNVFFGGISQYFDLNGVLTQDNNVPFVKTIARVSRDAQGNYSEHKLSAEMPSLLGAGSEFFPLNGLKKTDNGIIKLDPLMGDSILIGYILGGIESSAANIFFSNTGTQSSASNKLFKVYLLQSSTIGQSELNTQSTKSWQLQVSPNPSSKHLHIQFHPLENQAYTLALQDLQGKVIFKEQIQAIDNGQLYQKSLSIESLAAGAYFINLQNGKGEFAQQKLIIHK